jgi:predicted RNA binding protein YcfA (HicA-like mRNA interferase family)
MNARKTLQKILLGSKNIRFEDMVRLVEAYGFHFNRISGSHHIFTRANIPELVNLQNLHGQAKSYQINQFMKLVETHGLKLED